MLDAWLNKLRLPLIMGLLAGFLALLVGSLFLWQLHQHHQEAEQREVEELLTRHALQLEQQVSVGMAINELLAVIDALSGYGLEYRFYHQLPGGELQVVQASNGELLARSVKHELILPNGRWLLVASPADGWVNWLHLTLEMVPVLLISLLVGLLAAQMQRIKQMNTGLEKIITSRTAELQVSAMAFQSQNGILVTDAEQRIVKVNRSFQDITGYSEAEVLGQTPALLSSGRHDASFYQQMYADLEQAGLWQGEIWNRRKNGDIYPEHLTITAIYGAKGQITHYVANLADLTERKANLERIYQLKFFDALTHLPNRNLLRETLQTLLADTSENDTNHLGSLLFIDLDHFKQFNDALGRSVGDQLLQQLAQRLGQVLPPETTLARLGSDEFVVLLLQPDVHQSQAASDVEQLAETLLSRLNETFVLAGQPHHITASIGVTLIQPHDDPDELFKQAELAMFEAKNKGRNRISFYKQTMQLQAIHRLELQAAMYEALKEQTFELFYQPQLDANNQMKGVEALIRWQHPAKGYISPGEFIPLAEETDLILKIGHWVLETACAQAVRWSTQAATCELIISVNVSARQFTRPDFVQQVERVLQSSGANPKRLQLELTESMLADDTQDIINKMVQLKSLGLLISLDDFGTGYSSLSYLQQLPFDQLKVDQSFVRDINPLDPRRSLAATIIVLGLNLELEVIAEGVETPEQQAFLQQQGCQLFQGYLLGRPMPVAALEARIIANTSEKYNPGRIG
ncbi:MAG: EAL domain-containing protein [Marinospirillum sp.]|uniref:putative bifunctional diguanylate cyclase/phosphodiesterase n=1 Tax=Marinospirillum sp. TaxID=2183934 RepID=UPI0019E2D4F0|nr:EAL domain-containing protein [Marinospirillum sp.]MBE0508456.1 EAL domain-containing protein [Marinospirillum sp.]